MDFDPVTLKQLGLAGALLLLIYVVGMRMVAALDRIGVKVDDHTKADIAHHVEVKAAVTALTARIDTQKAVEDAVEAVHEEVSAVHEAAQVRAATPPGGYPVQLPRAGRL